MRQHPSRSAPTTSPVSAPASVLNRAFYAPVSRDGPMLAPSFACLPPPFPARLNCTRLRPGFPITLASRTPSLPTSEVPRSSYRLRQVVLQPPLKRGLDRSDVWRHAGRRRRADSDDTTPRPLRQLRVPLSFLWRHRVQCLAKKPGRRVLVLSRAAACSGSGRRTRRGTPPAWCWRCRGTPADWCRRRGLCGRPDVTPRRGPRRRCGLQSRSSRHCVVALAAERGRCC